MPSSAGTTSLIATQVAAVSAGTTPRNSAGRVIEPRRRAGGRGWPAAGSRFLVRVARRMALAGSRRIIQTWASGSSERRIRSASRAAQRKTPTIWRRSLMSSAPVWEVASGSSKVVKVPLVSPSRPRTLPPASR